MKTLESFDEAGDQTEKYIVEQTDRFIDANQGLVDKVGETGARAIFAGQVASHMYASPTEDIDAQVTIAFKKDSAAAHDLRQRAAHAAVLLTPAIAKAFGVLFMDAAAALPKASPKKLKAQNTGPVGTIGPVGSPGLTGATGPEK